VRHSGTELTRLIERGESLLTSVQAAARRKEQPNEEHSWSQRKEKERERICWLPCASSIKNDLKVKKKRKTEVKTEHYSRRSHTSGGVRHEPRW